MNQFLQNKYAALGAEEIQLIRHRLAASPRALRLLDFLEQKRKKKINTMDAVAFLYPADDSSFETLRNRFFKLRKQVIGLMESGDVAANGNAVTLLQQEEALYRCRRLIAENYFQLAKKKLQELLQECRSENIFELYPETVSQLIYCNLAMNVLQENEKLIEELTHASALLNDLRSVQAIARKAYLLILSRNHGNVPAMLMQMRRVAIRRKNYPRFRLFYHFTLVSYVGAIPAYSTKALARHITALKRLIAKHPSMPAGYFEPNAAALMHFYMATAEGTLLYMKGDIAGCYTTFRNAWEIMERTPNLRVRKSESFFANKIAIEVATGRFREALKTAEELAAFQKEQKQEEKRLKAFSDMAVIYTYAFPHLVCPDPGFIQARLKEYVHILRKSGSPLLAEALSVQVLFYFLCNEWKTVAKISAEPKVKEVFSKMGMDVYNALLRLTPSSLPEEVEQVKKMIEKMQRESVSSDRVLALKRAMNLLRMLEERMKPVVQR